MARLGAGPLYSFRVEQHLKPIVITYPRKKLRISAAGRHDGCFPQLDTSQTIISVLLAWVLPFSGPLC